MCPRARISHASDAESTAWDRDRIASFVENTRIVNYVATYVRRIYTGARVSIRRGSWTRERGWKNARTSPQLSSNRLVIPALLLKPLSRVSIDLSDRDYLPCSLRRVFSYRLFRTFRAFQRRYMRTYIHVRIHSQFVISIRGYARSIDWTRNRFQRNGNVSARCNWKWFG